MIATVFVRESRRRASFGMQSAPISLQGRKPSRKKNMLRWIVSLTALIAVSSVFAQGNSFGDHDSKDGGLFGKDDKGKGDDKGSLGMGHGSKDDDSKDDGSKDNKFWPTDKEKGKGDDRDMESNPKSPNNCVPEPASFLALGVGGVGFLLARKKKKA